jgi:hypothetical protein
MSEEVKNQTIIKPKQKLSSAESRKELWRRGILSWKLKSNQKELYDLFYSTEHKTQTWLLSRRSGKTFALALLAIEACVRTKNTIVKFVAPTKIQVNLILRPIMKEVLNDCPEELQPNFSQKDYIYYFPNGSEIQLAGSEAGHYQKLRGGSAHIAIVDEAQDVTDLEDVVKSVLLPTTLTTKGKVILSGTPPKNIDHDFVGYIEAAEARGSLVKKTIDDNPMITLEEKTAMIEELGGRNSEASRRELFCELIQHSSYTAIPEFTKELENEIVREWQKPSFYDTYEAMDLGFKDLTVVLFAYLDFKNDKLIIEDEIALQGQDLQLPKLVEQIKQKEIDLWTNHLTNEVIHPRIRVSDINHIVTAEISRASYGELTFMPAKKDDKQAAVNQLRVLLQNKQIIINPRCKVLIRHLRNVKWDKSRANVFSRSPDDAHYDAVDACVYLSRSVNFKKNPYPVGYGMNKDDLYVQNPYAFKNNSSDPASIYKKIFKIKGK